MGLIASFGVPPGWFALLLTKVAGSASRSRRVR